jgi:hypothetical protein
LDADVGMEDFFGQHTPIPDLTEDVVFGGEKR